MLQLREDDQRDVLGRDCAAAASEAGAGTAAVSREAVDGAADTWLVPDQVHL